jgi:deoxyribonuclease V
MLEINKINKDELRKKQRGIAKKIVLDDFLPNKIKTIGGFDIAYSKDQAYAAGVTLDYETLEIIESKVIISKVNFPYISTFLTFREGPGIRKVYEKLTRKPDILMFNGQGIAHPLQAGLASHLGVLLNKPSIGVAQSKLVGEYKEPKKPKEFSELFFEGKQVGWVLKTKEDCKPIFISPGHKISMERSLGICLHCLKNHKLPEPIRLAHTLAEKKTI